MAVLGASRAGGGRAPDCSAPRGCSPRRARLVAALLALAALVTAGCTDRGADEPTSDGGPMRLNVGRTGDSVALFPLFVAEQEGYFEDEGLTLGERPQLDTGTELAAALQSGSIDVAAGVMTDAFNQFRIDGGTKLIGSLTDEFYVDVVAGDSIAATVDGKPLADRVKALRGKKIGITGPDSSTEGLIVYLFRQQGLDPATDVTTVNLGSDASAALEALKSGRVDALSYYQPAGQQAEVTGVGRVLISPAHGDVPPMQNQTHGAVFTTQEDLDAKPAAVKAFLRAIARAEKTINDEDRARVTGLFEKYQGTLDPEVVETLIPTLQLDIPDDPSPRTDGYDASVAFHQDSGMIEAAPAYDSLVPTAFIIDALSSR
ncbi:ABC transporter substrate-binding protein [Kineosporia sp. J2-2]|uniref:ABC transporter substrate-binding protein n=1 Tax=Kineosporia corallincola TaxID=2835133 RepID=A0ABS5TGD7_9ACTN|nr:ABC transporter substrate-binding protein [Kineosporia corallincola]MBT0770136.1 ABC transporter substrate-binding protein [Kineosporia corallincola]